MGRHMLVYIALAALSLGVIIPNAGANTVTINIDGIDPYHIGTFQFYFYEEDGTFGWPMEADNTVFPPASDFSYDIGPAIEYPAYWDVETLLAVEGTYDYARGIVGNANQTVSANALQDGVLLSMSSVDTYFAVNLADERNGLFEMETDVSIIDMVYITESWTGDDQFITISATAPVVPLPASVLLLGSGLVGLFRSARKHSFQN